MSERYIKLFSLPENLYTIGSPVIIVAGALLKDSQTGKVLAQLKLRNIDVKSIKAAKVSISPLDTIGNPLGAEIEYQYLDLNENRDGEFGTKSPIFLTDVATRSFTVYITEVIFTDNTVWQSQTESWESLSVPVTLDEALKDKELVAQYRFKFGGDCKYEPLIQNDLWYCSCGELNHKEETSCYKCKKMVSSLLSVDMDSLKQDRDIRIAAEQKKAAEEKIAADIKARRTKKTVIFVSAIIILLISVVSIFCVVKRNKEEALRLEAYTAAVALYNAQQYEDALEIFNEIPEYPGSEYYRYSCMDHIEEKQAKENFAGYWFWGTTSDDMHLYEYNPYDQFYIDFETQTITQIFSSPTKQYEKVNSFRIVGATVLETKSFRHSNGTATIYWHFIDGEVIVSFNREASEEHKSTMVCVGKYKIEPIWSEVE